MATNVIYVSFKYSNQKVVYKKLFEAVSKLAKDLNKKWLITSGSRTVAMQKAMAPQVLRNHPGSVQRSDGSIWSKDGIKCWASAYGSSNHCFGLALDIPDASFEALDNKILAKYGLIKPMSHEPWHVEMISTRGLTSSQKENLFALIQKGAA